MPVSATVVLQVLVVTLLVIALIMMHSNTTCMAFSQFVEYCVAVWIECLHNRAFKKLLELVHD
jgi:hypothetical protein